MEILVKLGLEAVRILDAIYKKQYYLYLEPSKIRL